MKKLKFTLLFLLMLQLAHAQTTYYWVGGATTVTSFTQNATWTTNPVTRTPIGTSGSITRQHTDIFIFDGSNLGSDPANPVTGAVTITVGSIDTVAQLKVINGATVTLTRPNSGSAKIVPLGDGTSAPDLVVDAGSTLNIGGGGLHYSYQVILGPSATGVINGTVRVGGVIDGPFHTSSYITSPTAGAVSFESGSSCYSYDSTAMGIFNGSVIYGIHFKSGSSLYYYTGRSPIGSNSATQLALMLPGSNFYVMKSNVSYVDNTSNYSSSGWTNNKYFGNVFIKNGANFKADGPVYRIEDLTVDAGSSFTTHTSGQTGIIGNLTVNGTLSALSGSNTLVLGANGTVSVNGTGTINVPSVIVSPVTTVNLNNNISVVNGFTVNGVLNFGTNQVTGAGSFTSRGVVTPFTLSGGIINPGSYQLTGFPTPSGINGLIISGPGIAPNTVVLASTSGGVVNISQPATAAATGSPETYTFSSPAPSTLITSNPNGIGGSVTVSGAQNFSNEGNYVFNVATNAPFVKDTVGNVTLNAPVTTNKMLLVVDGTLTINNGKFTIPATNAVKLSSPVAGSLNATNYIVTEESGGNVGALQMNGITSAVTLPVGTASNYLPVSLNPVSASDFNVSVFEGVTNEGTPNGTGFNTSQKASVVDAVWLINRTSSNTDNCTVTVSWPSSLEGSSFASFTNSEIGIARHDGTSWGVVTGSGDNTANTATATFSNFSPFGVGEVGKPLPVQLTNFSAKRTSEGIVIAWEVVNEAGIQSYIVERSSDARNFSSAQTVKASGARKYNWLDVTPFSGNKYYRIKIISLNGEVKYSNILLVSGKAGSITAFPNPAKDFITLTGLKGNETVTISDINGRIIQQKYIAAGTVSATLHVASLIPGNYLIKITSASKEVTTFSVIKD